MFQGEVTDHLEVAGRSTVQGVIRRGATIRAGGVLVVQGAFVGQLVVEEGGRLHVQGTFNGDIVVNDGSVFVEGVVELDPADFVGRLIVGVGTVVILDDGVYELLADGHLKAISGKTIGKVSTRPGVACEFDHEEQRFWPLRA